MNQINTNFWKEISYSYRNNIGRSQEIPFHMMIKLKLVNIFESLGQATNNPLILHIYVSSS